MMPPVEMNGCVHPTVPKGGRGSREGAGVGRGVAGTGQGREMHCLIILRLIVWLFGRVTGVEVMAAHESLMSCVFLLVFVCLFLLLVGLFGAGLQNGYLLRF